MVCPLCRTQHTQAFITDDQQGWVYWNCMECDLVFRDPQSHLSGIQEKARYQTHNNTIDNEGYVNFLKPVVDLLAPKLDTSCEGLDFGCGPGPVLSELFQRQGYSMNVYDPFFYADATNLEKKYDFITCTEVVEHFYSPGQEFQKMNNLLKPEGYLAIMTEPRPDKDKFQNWYYRRDNTHVCFYNSNVWKWLCEHWGWTQVVDNGRISLFQKPKHQ